MDGVLRLPLRNLCEYKQNGNEKAYRLEVYLLYPIGIGY